MIRRNFPKPFRPFPLPKVPGAKGRAAQEAGWRSFLRGRAAQVCGGEASQKGAQEAQIRPLEAELVSL